LLRMEDTDQERSRSEYETEIQDSLKWLGLDWDGPVVRQSERLSTYQSCADRLIRDELAYQSEGSVKLRLKNEKIRFVDLVHGPVEFDSTSFDDIVILKSNGYPTYHFACVIDDHDSGITHLIRGDDHLTNTPKQMMLYRALNWNPPQYAHLPLVLGSDGSPLSKRHGTVHLAQYRQEGYEPEALINYLALLGWSGGGNQELFSKQQLMEKFSLKRVNKANATFDVEKLKWLNGEHLRALPDQVFVRTAKTYLESRGESLRGLSDETFFDIMLLFKSRLRIWKDLLWQTNYFWTDQIDYDPEAVRQHVHGTVTCESLRRLAQRLKPLPDLSDEKAVESVLRSTADDLKIPAKDLIHPTRVALTGRSVSPSLFKVMKLLGKEKVMRRFEDAMKQFGRNE